MKRKIFYLAAVLLFLLLVQFCAAGGGVFAEKIDQYAFGGVTGSRENEDGLPATEGGIGKTGVRFAYEPDKTGEKLNETGASANIELLKEKDALLDEIAEIIYKYHVDEPKADTLINGAVEGMLKALDDPYTNYYSAEEATGLFNTIEGNYEGIGVIIELGDDYPVAVEVLDNSPAQKAGMKNKDLIVKVDGIDTKGLSLNKVADMLRGPEGSKVRVTIRREVWKGGEERELVVTRAAVTAPSVSSELLDNDVGYININSFNSHTAREFYKALFDLQKKKISGLILDLRGNPGGLLKPAVDVAGSFIEAGKPVVTTVDRFGSEEIYRSGASVYAGGIKVAVLVNGSSASASEIVAGALQDYGRAVLVGEKTFGKGVVQWLLPLKAGGVLQVTVQKYYTPNGTCIHGNGLVPDRRVKMTALQIPAAVQEIKSAGRYEVRMQVGSNEAVVNGIRVKTSSTNPVDADKLSGEPEIPDATDQFSAPGATGASTARKPGLPGAPFVDGTQLFLPLRFSLEALGYEVEWLDDIQSVRVKLGSEEVLFYVQKSEETFNDKERKIENPIRIVDGLSYISADNLEMLGIKVKIKNTNIILERIVNN